MSDIASVADEPLTRAQIHMGEPEGEPLLDAVDLVAGYIPGVNILNGASLTCMKARSSASSARTAQANPPCSNHCSAWCTSTPASCC